MDGYEGRRVNRREDDVSYQEAAHPTPGGVKPGTTPVEDAFTRLVVNISELDENLSMLINRLTPVLNPEVRGEAGPDSVPMPPQSEFVLALGAQSDRLQRLNAVINDVHRRIEI